MKKNVREYADEVAPLQGVKFAAVELQSELLEKERQYAEEDRLVREYESVAQAEEQRRGEEERFGLLFVWPKRFFNAPTHHTQRAPKWNAPRGKRPNKRHDKRRNERREKGPKKGRQRNERPVRRQNAQQRYSFSWNKQLF